MSNEYTAEQMEADFQMLENCDHFTTGLEKRALARIRQAAQMMREQSPASINEALNVIEHWGIRGNTLSGDDVDRFRALVDKIAPRESVKVTDEDIDRALEAYSDADAECEIAYRPNMRAALESFATRPAVVPDGWKMVPVNATELMESAAHTALVKFKPTAVRGYPVMQAAHECYAAMLSAAPSADAKELE